VVQAEKVDRKIDRKEPYENKDYVFGV